MNKLLVIGNGFDLYLGRKTSYTNFFESDYYKDTKNQVLDWMKKVKTNTLGNANMHGYNFSCWDLLFCMTSYLSSDNRSLDNWCDIEKIIHDSFVRVVAGNFSWRDLFNSLQIHYSTLHVPGAQFESYLEKSSLEIVEMYCIKQGWKEYCKDKSLFYKKLLVELKSFERRFGIYIHEETGKDNYSDYAWSLARKLLLCNDKESCRIESFNYSDFSGPLVDIHHVNGDECNPIFGIDLSESELKSLPEAYMFTKTFRRVKQDSYNMNRNKNRLMIKLANAVVFGHSLNRMDYDYFNYLFTLLRFHTFDTAQMGSITFVYSIFDENKKDEIRTNYADAIYSLLNYYEGYVSNKNQHILINLLRFSGRLRIVDINDVH